MCFGDFIIVIIVGEALIQFKVQNEIHNWFFSSVIQPELPSLVQLEPMYLCVLCTWTCKCHICAWTHIYIAWLYLSSFYAITKRCWTRPRHHRKARSFIKRKTVPCGCVGRPLVAAAWDECLKDDCLLPQHSPYTRLRQCTAKGWSGPSCSLFLGSHFYLEEERQRNQLYNISPFNSSLSIY